MTTAGQHPVSRDTIFELDELHHDCRRLLKEGRRSPAMTAVLRGALQLFRENRLYVAMPILPDGNLQKLLSLKVTDVAFEMRLQEYLARMQVLYVGEIYLVDLHRGGYNKPHWSEIMLVLSQELRLPAQIDISGWRPPYWDEPDFLAALNRPIEEVVKEDLEVPKFIPDTNLPLSDQLMAREITASYRLYCHGNNLHYAGQLLRHWGKEPPQMAIMLESDRDRRLKPGSGLRQIALVPPDWQAPPEIPAEWLIEKAKIDEGIQRLVTITSKIRQTGTAVETSVWLKPIEEMDFSPPTRRDFKEIGVENILQLVLWTEDQLMATKKFGQRRIESINERLAEYGLSLGIQIRFEAPPETPAEHMRVEHTHKEEAILAQRLAGYKDHNAWLNAFDEDTRAKLLGRVDDLELSVRTQNVLSNAKIEYVWELVRKSEASIRSLKNSSQRVVNEIKEILQEKGLLLGMKPPKEPAEAPAEPS